MNIKASISYRCGALALLSSTVGRYAAASAPGPEHWHGGWHGGWGSGWGHMLFGSLMMLLFWGALVFAVVLAVRWLGSAGRGHHASVNDSGSRARAILEERFARGEIDAEEFEERKRRLSS